MLNEDDLREIQTIARNIKADITAHTSDTIAALKADLIARQDAAVETIAAEISNSRAELAATIQNLERRFETIAPTIIGTGAQISALTRGVDHVLALHGKITGDQAATQRALDQLCARVA